MSIWDQPDHSVRLEWADDGVTTLGAACAVLVIVDVLSFSTTTDLVTARGSRVLPLRWRDERGAAQARAAGATLAGESTWTLRPDSVTEIPAGTLLALPSPNGATLCAAAATTGAHVLAGCLRNASTVAARALDLADGRPVGIIPAGERWGIDLLGESKPTGSLRPCVEDQLGAGAIAAALGRRGGTLSAEAALAATAYAGADVREALRGCSSGRELAAAGHAGDVELAARVDVSATAPELHNGILEGR